MKTIYLKDLDRSKLADLRGMNTKVPGEPILQIRVGPAFGPLIQGRVSEIRDVAARLGLSSQNFAHWEEVHEHIGGGEVRGTPDELIELASQIGDIVSSVEQAHPSPNYTGVEL